MKSDLIVTCKQCNKNFKVERDRLGKQLYCSTKCYSESKKIELKCNLCGKVFKRSFHLVKNNCINYFCSKKCQIDWSKINPAWNRMDNPTILGSERVKQIKEGKFCSKCGSYFDLHIHHIDGNCRNNNTDNLEVLCKICHFKIHNRKHIPESRILYYKIKDSSLYPERNHLTDVGIDLKASQEYFFKPKEFCEVDLGIKVEIPLGCFGILALRSRLGKRGFLIHNGIIDSSYRGYLSGFLHNNSSVSYEIKKGDRVCQLLILPYHYVALREVSELENSERGEKGFGSSGR